MHIFSYPNITSKNIDFVEEAFNNNGKFLILNVTENCKLNNNIFGYKITSIKINSFQNIDFSDVETIDYGILFYSENEVLDSDSYFFLPEHSLKMDFCNYGFDESLFDNINIKFDYEIKMTDDILEYNEIWDDIDDSFGNRNDTNSYLKNTKTSFEFEINIILGKNMSTTCNDEDCALCLKENLDY